MKAAGRGMRPAFVPVPTKNVSMPRPIRPPVKPNTFVSSISPSRQM